MKAKSREEMIMENKLKKLFDYQRFENNEKLAKLIRESENRYAAALSDSELENVNAAGTGQTVGGLVGKVVSGTVTGYNTGKTDSKTEGTEFVGGLVGFNDSKE